MVIHHDLPQGIPLSDEGRIAQIDGSCSDRGAYLIDQVHMTTQVVMLAAMMGRKEPDAQMTRKLTQVLESAMTYCGDLERQIADLREKLAHQGSGARNG